MFHFVDYRKNSTFLKMCLKIVASPSITVERKKIEKSVNHDHLTMMIPAFTLLPPHHGYQVDTSHIYLPLSWSSCRLTSHAQVGMVQTPCVCQPSAFWSSKPVCHTRAFLGGSGDGTVSSSASASTSAPACCCWVEERLKCWQQFLTKRQ